MNCLFCRILQGEIPAKPVFSDELCFAFADIQPQAPTHILLIPRRHIDSLVQATAEDADLLGHLLATAAQIARQLQLYHGGYRVVLNTGDDGGQTVHHLHLHLLGGRSLAWPPG